MIGFVEKIMKWDNYELSPNVSDDTRSVRVPANRKGGWSVVQPKTSTIYPLTAHSRAVLEEAMMQGIGIGIGWATLAQVSFR